jgi:2,4-dienoyl-CoA reductase-like NADH-dependent reductase (Old Yellow Enzyme family)
MSRFTRVWEPLQVGPFELRHRILMPPHGQLFNEDFLPSERTVAYYRERAKGGAAMVGFGSPIAQRHTKGWLINECTVLEERCIPAFRRFADAVHEHGSRLAVELTAVGVNDYARNRIDDWHPVYGASRVPSPLMAETPAVMETQMLKELSEDFAQSAWNLAEAGVDAVELHGAHGYLLTQMLSPAFNKRTDEYGGTPENRVRLIVEMAEAIRARVGRRVAVGIRLSYDEFIGDAGITPEASDRHIALLADTGLFDYFNISCGSYYSLHHAVPPMGTVEDGFLVDYARRAREIVAGRAAVFVVGRIRTLAHAEQILEAGAADGICMMRVQMADPEFVRKHEEGREDEVMRCVGGNDCLAVSLSDRPIYCTVNPGVGRERQWGGGTLVAAARRKRVVVVGGGPGGLRAAGTAALRGHDVLLVERGERLGGHLELLSRLPTRETWGWLVDDLAARARRAGAELRTGVEATEELLRAEGAEAVVCATGSHWDRNGFTAFRPDRPDGIPGADAVHVIDVATAAERALVDPRSLGASVLIADSTGTYLPLGVADLLAQAGVAVEVLSYQNVVGEYLLSNLEAGWVLPRLRQQGVRLSPQSWVESIGAGSATVYEIWGGEQREVAADTVVVAMLRTPHDALFQQIRDAFPEVHRIGDCWAPRKTEDAIYEGEKAGRAL